MAALEIQNDGTAERPQAEPEAPKSLVPRLRLIREIDDRLLQGVVRRRSKSKTRALRVLSGFYDPEIAVLWVFLLWFSDPFWVNVGNRAGLAMAASAVVVTVIKRLVRRMRPPSELHALVPPDKYSFPSGHAAAAFALAISAFGSAPSIVPVLVLVAGAVGYARMYLGVHYPVDVAVGALIGTFMGSIAALI